MKALRCHVLLVALVGALPAPAAAQSRDLATYVLFASDWLRANGTAVVSGDVGVNDGLLFASNPIAAPTSQLVADYVRISPTPTSTCAALFANLTMRSSPACGPAAAFESPIVPDVRAACGFPDPFPDCDPAAPVTVAQGEARQLGPGVYGAVTVLSGSGSPGGLVLTGGRYVFCSLRASRNAAILARGPSTVHVNGGTVRLSNGTVTGPGLGLSALDVRVFASGVDVHFSRGSTVRARVCAPNAMLRLTHGAALEGQFVGRGIRAGRIVVRGGVSSTTTSTSTTTTTSSSSSSTTTTTAVPVCGNGVVEAGEQCDPPGSLICSAGSAMGALVGVSADTLLECRQDCTCPEVGELPVEICGNCFDDDGNGVTDFEDPACCPQGRTHSLTLRRGRIRPRGPSVSRLRLRAILAGAGLAQVNPQREDVFLQLRPENGTDILCARMPASRFKKRGLAFKFRDPESTVASARGLARIGIKVKRDGSVRLRGGGKRVEMTSPGQGRLQVTVGFRTPPAGEAQNRCSTAVAAFRSARKGIRAP